MNLTETFHVDTLVRPIPLYYHVLLMQFTIMI